MEKRLIILLLGLMVSAAVTGFADQDLQVRFEKSLRDAKSLSTLEIEYLDTLSITDPEALKVLSKSNQKEFSRTFQYTYISSGLKYLARAKLISGTETNLVNLSESAYDGKSYTAYSSGSRTLALNCLDTPADGLSPVNPLIASFAFLTKAFDGKLHMLRFTDLTSEEFTKGFSLPPGLKTNGLIEVTIPSLPSQGQTNFWKIIMNEAGDSFTPKSIEHIFPETGVQFVYKLLDYTNLGTYQFPSKIDWTENSYPPTSQSAIRSSGTATLISAHIPEQVDGFIFELKNEEELTDSIWDWNQHNFVRVASVYSPTNACAPYVGFIIYDEAVDASKQISEAIATAKKEQKNVLIQFGANWSGPCHELHELLQTNKVVAEQLKRNYVEVMVDVNKGHNADIDEKFGHPTHYSLPVLVVLNSEGKQLITEDTSGLRDGQYYTPDNVMIFLKKWAKNE